jgi:hypothetical protein
MYLRIAVAVRANLCVALSRDVAIAYRLRVQANDDGFRLTGVNRCVIFASLIRRTALLLTMMMDGQSLCRYKVVLSNRRVLAVWLIVTFVRTVFVLVARRLKRDLKRDLERQLLRRDSLAFERSALLALAFFDVDCRFFQAS